MEWWNDGFKENEIQSTYPVFHHSMWLAKRIAAKRPVISINCRNSDTYI
jgi:hypothetical protein